MKRKLLLLWTFLLCFAAGVSAQELTRTITFKECKSTSDDATNEVFNITDIIVEGNNGVKTETYITKMLNGKTIMFLRLFINNLSQI